MNTSAVSPGRAGLLLLLSGQMLPLIDTSITNVALDAITHTLAASATQLELIVALYGVAFAVCLAMGSKLGDNYGRRRLFMWGVALFGIASLLCGMANSIGETKSPRCCSATASPPLATKTPAVADDCQQRRQQDPHQRRVAEQAQQPRHQLAVGEQTAQGNQHTGQRGPEGIATQAPPVEGETRIVCASRWLSEGVNSPLACQAFSAR